MPVVTESYAYAWGQMVLNLQVFSGFGFEVDMGLQTCIHDTDDYIFTILGFLEEAGLLWWLIVKAKKVPTPSCVQFVESVTLHSDNFRELYIQNN
jgi:hypothetical protein